MHHNKEDRTCYTDADWNKHFKKSDQTWLPEDCDRWDKGEYTTYEWEMWVKYGDFYWLRTETDPSPSVAKTESPIASLEINTPGNEYALPSDEEELAQYLESQLWGSSDEECEVDN